MKLSACSGCQTAIYCGRACQRAHWPEHKATCKQTATVNKLLATSTTKAEPKPAKKANKKKKSEKDLIDIID